MSRLSTNARPVRYRLDLDVDPGADRFGGEVEIEITLEKATRQIELHSVDLDIAGAEAADARGSLKAERIEPRARRETVVLRFPRALVAGEATLRLRFSAALRTDLRGLYLARSGKRRYATTQLEATDARRMFPCFDEPDRKARFDIRVTTPKRYEAVSNGRVLRVEPAGRRKTVHFAETPPLSTYLIALVVGELEASPRRMCGPTPIRVWAVPGNKHLMRFALECAVESLDRLERYFGIPYPYDKLDLIAVPDFEFGAMENAGAVIFRETLLLTDPKTLTFAERKRVAEVIAHELAHMWFGDLVTMAWWDDLWLNEAFATWMAFTIVDQWQPDWNMWLDFEHGKAAALAEDALRNTHPIYIDVRTPDEAQENFDLITYEKGASVVRMLERWLGAATFRRGVRAYIRAHRESNARGADLWQALERASGEPVRAVAEAWIQKPGYPELRVSLSERAGRATLSLRQSRFFSTPRVPDEARKGTWPIPAILRVRANKGRTRLDRQLLRRASARVDLGPADSVRWVYANADESGFYRPVHDAKLLEALAPEVARLPAVERLGIVGHQWAALRAGSATVTELLRLVEGLKSEPWADVLDAAAGPLATLAGPVALQAGDEVRDGFRRVLADWFAPGFEELGWKPRRGEQESLRLRRAALLRIAGSIAEHTPILDQVGPRLDAYLKSRASLDANLVGSVVELGARTGDTRRFDAYLRSMRAAKTPQERTRFELALGSFREPDLIERTLELALGDDVPTQDVVPLLMRLLQNRRARERTWQFIQERWSDLQPRVTGGLAARLVRSLALLETRTYRSEVAGFFRAHPIPSAARALRQALEEFDRNAELRRRVGPQLRDYVRERN